MADITTTTTRAWDPPAPNPALYTNEHHAAYLADSPPLLPGPDDCIIRMRSNGICGSDAHFWRHGGIGSLKVTSAYVLGHEGAGEVVHTGSSVSHLRVGDRVSVEPGVPCGECGQCSRGSYNLCREVKFSGAPPYNGSVRRYHLHPAKFLHKIPDGLSFTEGALLEPFSVALRAFELAPVRLGESTVVCGAGPIGLCALAIAKASGARPIVVLDVDQGRLEFAKNFVPECTTFQVQAGVEPEETARRVNETIVEAVGAQPRVVYECTGVESSVIAAAHMPQPGGTVMVIGVGRTTMDDLPFMHMVSLCPSWWNTVGAVPNPYFPFLYSQWQKSISNLSIVTIILGLLLSGFWRTRW